MDRPTSTGVPLSETARRRTDAMEQTYELCETLYTHPYLWVQVTTDEDKHLKLLYSGSTDWSRVEDYTKKVWWRCNIIPKPPHTPWWRKMFGGG